MSKYVENFKIEDEVIQVKDPEAMPKAGGTFTGNITAPGVTSTGNVSASGTVTAGGNMSAGGNMAASGNITGSNMTASNAVKGSNAKFGYASKSADTYVSAENENGEVSLFVGSNNRGIYDPFSDSWMQYRGEYEGVQSYRTQATSLFLNGYPIHHPDDSGWKNLEGTWLRYRKVDRRIIVRCDARTNTALAANAWTTIGTLPHGYIPGYDYYGTGYQVSQNVVIPVYIGTNGKIQLYNPTAAAIDSYSFTAEFLRSDTQRRMYILSYNLGEFADGQGSGMTEADYQAKINGMQNFFNNLSADVMLFTEYRDYIDADETHSARTELFPSATWPSFRETDLAHKKCALYSKTSTSNFTSGYLVPGQSDSKYIDCETMLNGHSIHLVDVHLHFADPAIRSAEMDALMTLTAGWGYCIIGGDFNFETAGDEYKTQFAKATAAGFRMANGELAGWIKTWHKDHLTHYIDNILVKGGIDIGAVNVPKQAGDLIPSDHLPIWTYIEVYD